MGTPFQIDAAGGIDTYLDENLPTTNYGSYASIYIGHLSKVIEYRILLRKDFTSDIPAGATIDTATLHMDASNVNQSKPYKGYRIRRGDWVEGQATWNIFKTGSNWTIAGCYDPTNDYDSSIAFGPWTVATPAGWKTVDVVTFLQDAVDNRSRIFNAVLFGNWTPLDENDVGYHSIYSEDFADSDYHWYIDGEYTAAAAGGSRNRGHVFGSRLGLPSLPEGWRRRRGLLVPAGY